MPSSSFTSYIDKILETQILKTQSWKLKFDLKIRKVKETDTGSYFYFSPKLRPDYRNLRMRL